MWSTNATGSASSRSRASRLASLAAVSRLRPAPAARYIHPKAVALVNQEGDHDADLDLAGESASNYLTWVAELCRPHLGYRVLEVGAGLGAITARYERGREVVANDVSPRCVGALRERFADHLNVRVEDRDLRIPGRCSRCSSRCLGCARAVDAPSRSPVAAEPSPLPRYDAYAASKAAIVRLTENLAASEEMSRSMLWRPDSWRHASTTRRCARDPTPQVRVITNGHAIQLAEGGFPAGEAAELVCFLLSEQARGISGRLISAQWDPWREEGFRARLRANESLAKLRRIDEQFFARIEG